MTATFRFTNGHTATLSALEVLRLMADRYENDSVTDAEDVQFVLDFFGNVSSQCADPSVSELLAELDRCFKTGHCAGFVEASRRYTDSVMRVLSSDISIQAEQTVWPTLRRLETKYVAPHCI
jgi:hypothetical protein